MLWNYRLIKEWNNIFLAEVYYEEWYPEPVGYAFLVEEGSIEGAHAYLYNKKNAIQTLQKDSEEYREEIADIACMEMAFTKEVLDYKEKQSEISID